MKKAHPVSYTHLDVYKRQVNTCPADNNFVEIRIEFARINNATFYVTKACFTTYPKTGAWKVTYTTTNVSTGETEEHIICLLYTSWRASDEFFFDWAKPVLTDAKFRVSWGTNGNERVGNYESINQYNIGSYYNGVIGVTQTDKLANLDLSWESTEQTNIGLDVTLLDGRVSLAAEYYIKKTKDLLADEAIPLFSILPILTRILLTPSSEGITSSANRSLVFFIRCV